MAVSRLRRALSRGGARIAPEAVERAELAFYVANVEPGATVLDVGAHVGELSLLFSRLVGSTGVVHAFEPVRATFDRLSRVVEASGRQNIRLHSVAVADADGERTINIYGGPEYSSWSSLADRDLHAYGVDRTATETVPALTLDTFCNGLQGPIGLLKVDAEGAELQVLRGARSLLETRRIRACVFEYGGTTAEMGNDPDQIERYLADVGYRLENVVPGAPCFPGRGSDADFAMLAARPA